MNSPRSASRLSAASSQRLFSCLWASIAAVSVAVMAPYAAGQAIVPVGVTGTDSEAALALANLLKGSGVQSFSNVTLTAKVGAGTTKGVPSSSAGTFTGGSGVVGISSGIILSSGGVFDVPGPNTRANMTQSNGTGGDADLAGLINVPETSLHDKTVLEFDFVPTYPTIAFRYVFSSDEFNEYANSQYNDVFGFFVNGTAPGNNIARIPGTASPVSINNVNGGNPIGTNPQNAQYFINNTPQTVNMEMDGLTVVLTAQTAVTPGIVNHIKIAIADVIDEAWDSNVFLEESSFVSGHAPVALNDGYKTPQNTALTVIDSGVLANDSDQDGNLQHAQLITKPAHGTVVLNAAGGFTYTPTAAYSGPDSFTYQAVDATDIQSNVATVDIEVGAANSPPTGSTSTVSIPKNAVSSIGLGNFVFNDADPGNSLTAVKIISVTKPATAKLQLGGVNVAADQMIFALAIGNGDLEFTPVTNAVGNGYATISYQVSDGVSLSATQTLTVNVLNVAPEIAVSGNKTNIPINDLTPTLVEHTDFGSARVANGTVNRIFTIKNSGTAPLRVDNVTVTGANAADFDVTIQPATNVPAGTFTTFSVQFDPSAPGVRTATLNFSNSDSNESPYKFAIKGFGGDPEIAVEQPAGTAIADGGSAACPSSGVGVASAPITFTVKNPGNANLILGTITKDGANPGDFTISTPTSSVVAPGGSSTFTVTFTPGAIGARSAVLHIPSDDADEDPYDITVTGAGVAPSTIDIDATATISVFEEAGSVDINLVRTGNTVGPVSVKLSTVNGTAKAPGDFTALTNYVVNFADGETSKTIPITIIADSLATEINEFFSVELSDPTNGAALGSTTTATVRIIEPDLVIPTVSVTSPAGNATIPEGAVNLTGSVTDAKGLDRAEYSLNGGAWTPLPVTLNATGLMGTFSIPISPVPGDNTVKVRGFDFHNNMSNEMVRGFTYVVMRPLALTVTPTVGGTVTITPALSGGLAQIGVSYTLKATPEPDYLWVGWTAPGVSGAAAESTTLVITMTAGLAINADFVINTIFDGTYTGLAIPKTGVTATTDNVGLVSGTLSTTGTLSGRVTYGGTAYPFTAKFDPVTLHATGTSAGVNFDFQLNGTTKKMTGTVSLAAVGDVCDVDADLAVFDNTNLVPAQFLNAATTGTYTVVFAAKEQTPARDHHEYPQGDGFGKVTLYSTGSASMTGTLADGTTITLSTPLSKDYRWPLAGFIKASAMEPGTTFAGMVKFDVSQADSDLYATNMRWFRTAFPSATSYSAGWNNGITVDAVGALYSSTTSMQTTLQLGAADAANGNGKLEFTDGKLTSPITKTNFNLVVNTVGKIPATDPSFSLSPAAGTGTFSGSFAPNWSNPAAIKPTYRGTVLQKGANRGGYGFFISNAVGDTAGESGRVTLGPP